MGKLVSPKVYFVGYTTIDREGLLGYLRDSDNEDFIESVQKAKEEGLSDGEILCSFFAKLCYNSLSLGHNLNISRTRDIPDNLRACFDSSHLSVLEHCTLNFVIRNCSRVFEAEMIRHRVGTAYSVSSGRYVRSDSIDIVFDPILEPVRYRISRIQNFLEDEYAAMVEEMGLDKMSDFTQKKKITSALRRIMPEGKAKEVGVSLNLRALRHIVQLRTSRHAEYEIRNVFGQVYKIVKNKYPLIFYGAKEEVVDDLLEVSGMKQQPYDRVD